MSIIICKRKTHKEKLINKEKEVEKEERAIEKKRNRRRALIPYFHVNSYTNQHKRSDVYDPENNSIIFGILLTFIFRKSHLKSWMKITNKNRDSRWLNVFKLDNYWQRANGQFHHSLSISFVSSFTHDLERDLNFPFLICLLFHRDFLKRIWKPIKEKEESTYGILT